MYFPFRSYTTLTISYCYGYLRLLFLLNLAGYTCYDVKTFYLINCCYLHFYLYYTFKRWRHPFASVVHFTVFCPHRSSSVAQVRSQKATSLKPNHRNQVLSALSLISRGREGQVTTTESDRVWFLNRILRLHSFVPPPWHCKPSVMFAVPAFPFSGLFPSNWVRPEHTTYKSDCVLSSDAVGGGRALAWISSFVRRPVLEEV